MFRDTLRGGTPPRVLSESNGLTGPLRELLNEHGCSNRNVNPQLVHDPVLNGNTALRPVRGPPGAFPVNLNPAPKFGAHGRHSTLLLGPNNRFVLVAGNKSFFQPAFSVGDSRIVEKKRLVKFALRIFIYDVEGALRGAPVIAFIGGPAPLLVGEGIVPDVDLEHVNEAGPPVERKPPIGLGDVNPGVGDSGRRDVACASALRSDVTPTVATVEAVERRPHRKGLHRGRRVGAVVKERALPHHVRERRVCREGGPLKGLGFSLRRSKRNVHVIPLRTWRLGELTDRRMSRPE